MRARLHFAAIAITVVVTGALAVLACGQDAPVPAPDGGGGGDARARQDAGVSVVDASVQGDASAIPALDAGITGATPGAYPDDGAPGDATPDDAAPEVDCPASSLAPGDYIQTLGLDGGTRTFSIHVPAGLDARRPAPLVLAFHGGGQNAWQFEGFTHLHAKSDAAGFVLVEPDGTPALGPSPIPQPSPDAGVVLEVWNAGNCCEYAATRNGNVDDVGFVAEMLDAVEAQICIDPRRVHATGFSNGGMLSHRLACEMSGRIASIVAVSGGSGATDYDLTPPQALFACAPPRPVPVLHVHGTQDACYPFDGGWGPLSLVTFEPVMTTVEGWVARNGCGSGPPAVVSNNGAATCSLYPCPHQGDVELCTIDGGGHYWPGGDDWPGSTVFCGSGQGVRSADLIANDLLWSWFIAHPMP
jgi:polyhydroxybutyrate depolymerase